MTNQEALEIGLVLAELESQLKARETPASPEEAGEMLREIMARKAAAEKPLAGESVTEPALPKSLTIFSGPFGPKDYGTVRLGLQLAELERQRKEKALREIAERHAAEREKLQRPSPEASMSEPEGETFALVEDGTSRVWLFLAGAGSVNRLLDGTWVDEWRTPDEVIMPDELGDFREASDSELSTLLQEAAASSTLSPERASATLQAEKQQKKPTSDWPKEIQLSEEKLKLLMVEREKERLEDEEEQRRINPHGVPIIFPFYD